MKELSISDFLEESYVEPLKEKGYLEVDKMSIPNGTYRKAGGGYATYVLFDNTNDTGYVIISELGIKGSWNSSRDFITIENGKSTDKFTYKILSINKLDKREEKLNSSLIFKSFVPFIIRW